MASLYPNAEDVFSIIHADNVGEVIHAQTTNDNSDAINHIELELGTLPKGTYSDVAARLNAMEAWTFNLKNVTSYTLIATDKNKCISFLNASPATLIVPNDSSVNFALGTVIAVRQNAGAGQVTVQGATGVTVGNADNLVSTQNAWAWIYLIKTGANQWDLLGQTA